MKVKFNLNSVTLTREPGDPKFYGKCAKGEHLLLHYLCKWLNARGFKLIKKRIEADSEEFGHMMGDQYQPYLRPPKRSPGDGPHIFIVSGFYALRDANEDWNAGEVVLNVYLDVLGKQPDCEERLFRLRSPGEKGAA